MPGGFRIAGVVRDSPREALGEYHADRAKCRPLRTRRAGTRLIDGCLALLQPGVGALRYVLASAANVPQAKQTRRAAVVLMRNNLICMAFSQV